MIPLQNAHLASDGHFMVIAISGLEIFDNNSGYRSIKQLLKTSLSGLDTFRGRFQVPQSFVKEKRCTSQLLLTYGLHLFTNLGHFNRTGL
jgi:hypothetical protein